MSLPDNSMGLFVKPCKVATGESILPGAPFRITAKVSTPHGYCYEVSACANDAEPHGTAPTRANAANKTAYVAGDEFSGILHYHNTFRVLLAPNYVPAVGTRLVSASGYYNAAPTPAGGSSATRVVNSPGFVLAVSGQYAEIALAPRIYTAVP